MTVRVYRSSDASAPVYTGEVGKLTDLLYACLVTGYGALPGAGWTRPYTGTNGATFLQGGGLGYGMNVNDNGPGAAGAREARYYWAEAFSAFDTPTNRFPTTTQFANGLCVRKSATADATSRPWLLAANAQTFYLFALAGDTVGAYLGIGGGAFFSVKGLTDLGRCFAVARATENSGGSSVTIESLPFLQGNIATNSTGLVLARDAQNNVGAILGGLDGDTASGSGANFAGTMAYPNPADLSIYLAPLAIHHTVGGNTIRGRLPGLWHFRHPITGVADGTTFSGTGDLAGRSFEILKTTANGLGVYVLETSNTWDSN